MLKTLEPSIRPQQKVSTLSVAKKQIIEIAKAVASDADIIIMDEPTAAISEAEIQKLFEIVKGLREKNVTVIYISHRLDEIFALGDYVTVMRDGHHIETKEVSRVADRAELIKMMIGKTVYESYIPPAIPAGEPILEAEHICNHKLRDISFTVKKGEIVGFYGLVGAGKTEIARAIYGVDPYHGEIRYKGKKFSPSPSKAIATGIALVPEERRSQGLFTGLTIRCNVPVMSMKKISKGGFLNTKQECRYTTDYIDKLNIATSGMEKEVSKLSGGNQQKVVFAKCLFADADLLMLDEPTRGIDVGAKNEIYNIIRKLREEGKSVIIFSSELPEIVNMCDRIYLLYDGHMKTEIQNGVDIDSQQIIHVVTGGK
jgi:ribose transport system ATP-binding protein